jgi:putative transposase
MVRRLLYRSTIRFQVLYVFLVLAHERRRTVHVGVTSDPTAEWTVQQLREAFAWHTSPRFLLRDRDHIFGQEFVEQVEAFGIRQVLWTPRSPWERACVERVIGTNRRECLDHVIVFGDLRVLRGRCACLCRTHSQWIHAAFEGEAVRILTCARILRMPVRKPS